jgi:hypothetical protein
VPVPERETEVVLVGEPDLDGVPDGEPARVGEFEGDLEVVAVRDLVGDLEVVTPDLVADGVNEGVLDFDGDVDPERVRVGDLVGDAPTDKVLVADAVFDVDVVRVGVN